MHGHPGDRRESAQPSPDASIDDEDAFGHPVIADPERDDAVWPDGDEDDIDV